MSKLWFFVTSFCMVFMVILSPDTFLSSSLTGVETGIKLSMSLLSVYCLWSGIIAVLETSGLSNKISRLLSPVVKKLFPHESDKTREYVSLNIATNMLGAGGAATPLGIKAITSMYNGGTKATFSMVLFTVINTTSVQLIPSTIMGILASNGATTPHDIILPSLIASTFATLLGVLLVYCFQKNEKRLLK